MEWICRRLLSNCGREEQLVFITAHGDIPMCAQAMKAGAVDFLPKPFKPTQLLESVERALATLDRTAPPRIGEKSRARSASTANAA